MSLIQNDFVIDGVRVSPTRNLIISDNGRFQIEPRIMDVLCVLASDARDVVSREDLISKIWKVEFGGDESLTRAISLLRKTFKKSGLSPKIIETIPKRGYRLAKDIEDWIPVEATSQPAPARPTAAAPATPASAQTSAIPVSQPVQTADSTNEMPPALHQQATPVSGGRAKPSPILLFVPVLLAAIFGGWLLGQQGSSGPSDTTPPATPGETRPAEQPAPEGSGPKTRAAEAGLSQAEIAMSMLRAYEDGNISKQPALLTAAERYLQKANQEDPGHVNTLTASGWLKYYQNKYNDGLIMFERAIAEDPIHAEAWLGKARILKETGNYELALINADQTIRLDSLSVAGRLLRAEILGAQGDIDGAEAEIDDLMKFNSQYSKAIIYQERLGVFKSYDNDRNGLIMPGDISANDGKIHEIQNSDGKPGLSIEEFRVRGETSIETTASGQTLFQYDLSDPENPKIREWQKAE